MEQGLKWDVSLFPLAVLLGPTLRLRYRAAWEQAAEAINSAVGKQLFKHAVEATGHEAFSIEFRDEPLWSGVVYVCDCMNRADTDGHTVFFNNSTNIVSAKIFLPKGEESPYDTERATLHQACHCLGLHDSDDPTSVMWPKVHERPVALSESDIQILNGLCLDKQS